MQATERISFIKNKLYSEKKVTIAYIAKKLNVSYPTVRKDFNLIANSDKNIKKIHGGLCLESKENDTLDLYAKRLIKNEKQKREIASKALSFIPEKSTILLDSSSTTFELARAMCKLDYKFTVITNGISTARLLSTNNKITVIILPGIIHKDSNTVIDEFNFNFSDRFNVDIFIFSATGLTLEGGFSEYNLQEVSHKNHNIKLSKKAIALIDSSKFGKASSANFAKLEDIDILITDNDLDTNTKSKYATKVNII